MTKKQKLAILLGQTSMVLAFASLAGAIFQSHYLWAFSGIGSCAFGLAGIGLLFMCD